MKNRNISTGLLWAFALWLFGAHYGRCFYNSDAPVGGNTVTQIHTSNRFPSVQADHRASPEPIAAATPAAKANRFRFPTKPRNDETDTVYYGYRYYNASTGRWITRDPVSDPGFGNASSADTPDITPETAVMYTFVRNDPVDFFDATGLLSITDILGLTFNPPCGSLSVQGSVKLSNWHVTGIGLVNKVPCNGIRLFLKGKINDALGKLPYSKTWTCKNGTCITVASIGPLTFTLSPSVPLVFSVDLAGNWSPPAKPKCKVDLELSGTITASGTIGYCCGNK
jgi:RHS repeat-associated protein